MWKMPSEESNHCLHLFPLVFVLEFDHIQSKKGRHACDVPVTLKELIGPLITTGFGFVVSSFSLVFHLKTAAFCYTSRYFRTSLSAHTWVSVSWREDDDYVPRINFLIQAPNHQLIALI